MTADRVVEAMMSAVFGLFACLVILCLPFLVVLHLFRRRRTDVEFP